MSERDGYNANDSRWVVRFMRSSIRNVVCGARAANSRELCHKIIIGTICRNAGGAQYCCNTIVVLDHRDSLLYEELTFNGFEFVCCIVVSTALYTRNLSIIVCFRFINEQITTGIRITSKISVSKKNFSLHLYLMSLLYICY